MTFHLALAGEAVRDDIYPVVSLSALPRAGMAFVPIRLVENLERDRRQSCGQAGFDPLLHGHGGHPSLFATRRLARRKRRVVIGRRIEQRRLSPFGHRSVSPWGHYSSRVEYALAVVQVGA